ncbi:MAG: XTP/dITP diphosphatase [Thaumarchaeota archaeon]|nr:XTP/dITP diphosphatase [Candidatus Calditenuaceae archaeon]MDW8187550.1 XTP/dITP diphosphatase [Nitrososphaerota archaeon]
MVAERPALKFVTSNEGKWTEVSRLLRSLGVECTWVAASLTEVQSDDLSEIAKRAAVEAHGLFGGPLAVEDSGLFVEELRGFPGPYTSYVYRTLGVHGLLKLMSGVRNRRAYFESAVGYVDTHGLVRVFLGRVEGTIAEKPEGFSGFGFDPVFVPEGETRTFAEMSTDEKNLFSHRARALRSLVDHLLGGP